jgi:hypothetical protein
MGHPGLAVSERGVYTEWEFIKIGGVPGKGNFHSQENQWDIQV